MQVRQREAATGPAVCPLADVAVGTLAGRGLGTVLVNLVAG